MRSEILEKYGRPVPRYTSYPTAPHFHAGVDAACYGRWLAALPEDEPLSLYLHIPFCDSLCWFCGCHTKIVARYAPVSAHLDLLMREIAIIAERLGTRHPVGHMHWGGGTPTILRPADIAALVALMKERFAFRPDAEFAVEIDPRTLEQDTVEALAAAGVTRASLGVQDVNPDIQRAINRIQPIAVTAQAAAWLRAAGITALNFDLMYGLPGQTVERVLTTVDAVLALEPERIALFGYAHVPWLKAHQRLIDEAALPDGPARAAQAEAAAEKLRAAGYRAIGLDHFARSDDAIARAQPAGRLHRNFQGYTTDASATLVGFGASAIGSLPQGYVQNATALHDYRDAIEAGRPAVVRGIAISDEDRLRRAVIERLMCDLTVDLEAVSRGHGRAPETFDDEVAALAEMARDGIVTVAGRRVTVPEEARALLRTVCAVFDRHLASGKGRHSRAV